MNYASLEDALETFRDAGEVQGACWRGRAGLSARSRAADDLARMNEKG